MRYTLSSQQLPATQPNPNHHTTNEEKWTQFIRHFWLSFFSLCVENGWKQKRHFWQLEKDNEVAPPQHGHWAYSGTMRYFKAEWCEQYYGKFEILSSLAIVWHDFTNCKTFWLVQESQCLELRLKLVIPE